MWKKFPLMQDYDSEKIVGEIMVDERIIEKIQQAMPAFIKEKGIGIPLKLGYSGLLKKGSFTIKDFSIVHDKGKPL